MDNKVARIAVRVGKEMSESLLVGYKADYALGLGVALLMIFEIANDKPKGSAQELTVSELLDWVRTLQAQKEKEMKEEFN